jgi:DNA-binding MarR family transcriptional regulator
MGKIKQTAVPGPPTEDAFRAFIRTYGLVKKVMEPYFTRFGISDSQWGVLRSLHRAEQNGQSGLRLTDLGDRLLIRPPSVTGVVDRLQRSGLVSRSACQTDLRAKNVSLTDAGRALVLHVLEEHSTKIGSVLAGLSLEQQRTLHQLLKQWGSHLELLTVQVERIGEQSLIAGNEV